MPGGTIWVGLRLIGTQICGEIPIENRTLLYDTDSMKGHEFVARARRYARARGLECSFDPRRGKGSHGMLSMGGRKTTVASGEIPKGTLYDMLKQLGIKCEDF